jgi:hypothetical protein
MQVRFILLWYRFRDAFDFPHELISSSGIFCGLHSDGLMFLHFIVFDLKELVSPKFCNERCIELTSLFSDSSLI